VEHGGLDLMTGKLSLLVCLAVLIVSSSIRVFSAGQTVPSIPVTGKIQWVLSYSEGQKLARETGKPLFVVFRCER
jgi:hypothetical protein